MSAAQASKTFPRGVEYGRSWLLSLATCDSSYELDAQILLCSLATFQSDYSAKYDSQTISDFPGIECLNSNLLLPAPYIYNFGKSTNSLVLDSTLQTCQAYYLSILTKQNQFSQLFNLTTGSPRQILNSNSIPCRPSRCAYTAATNVATPHTHTWATLYIAITLPKNDVVIITITLEIENTKKNLQDALGWAGTIL